MGSSKAPKPSKEQNQLAKAQAANMTQQTALTADYYAWARQQAELDRARGDEQWNFQRGLAEDAEARSRALYDRYWDTTAKQEDEFYRLVDQYDAGAEGARMSGRGIADVEAQLDTARGAGIRGLQSRGWNPNSAAMQSSMMDMELEGALAKASASTMAYEAAKREGLNLRAAAAGLGTYTQGQSGGYMGQAGNLGTSALAAGGTGLRSGALAWQGQNAGSGVASAWGSAANSTFNSIAEQNYRASQSGGTGLGGLVGGLAGSMLGPAGAAVGSAVGKWGAARMGI